MRTEPSFSAEPEDDLLDDTNTAKHSSAAGYDEESQLLADYRQRYGLSVDPFADDPHFPFYTGANRRHVLDQLLHLCQFSHNVLLVAGDYGTGKTRMAQALIDNLDDRDDICFVEGQINSDLDGLLKEILEQLELDNQSSLNIFCQKKTDQDGLLVLIVDNAHHLADDVILDLLEFTDTIPESRLHLVLLGEPYLQARLGQLNGPGFAFTALALEKFSLNEAVDYLNFRMEMADYLGPEIFTESVVDAWWRQAQGQLLALHEYAQDKLLASVTSPRAAYKSAKRGLPIPHIIAVSGLITALFLGWLYMGSDSGKNNDKQLVEPIPVAKLPAEQTIAMSSFAAASETITASSVQAVTTNSNTANAASSVASLNAASVTSFAKQESSRAIVVKESVVPLVQTNTLHSDTPKVAKSSSAAIVKENKRVEASSASVKVAVVKPKNDESIEESPKGLSGLTEQEKIILGWDSAEYTLQIVGLSNEKSAHDFIAAQPNKKDLLLFRGVRQGKDWFVVVSGHYPSSAKARQAAQDLPDSQKTASPWPREIKVVQKEIKMR